VLISSYLPYLFLKETKHIKLSEAEERIKKLYPDNDGDLLNDNIEINVTLTSITNADSDHDFFPDGAEFDYWNDTFHNIIINREQSEIYLPTGDLDGDGLSNILDPDSDSDGVPDGWEIENGLFPFITDSDANGYSDRFEYYIYYNYFVNSPLDVDGDLLPDFWESYFKVSDPDTDDDADGVSNINEWLNGSDPTVKDERYGFNNTEAHLEDSDNDGLTDQLELAIGINPYDPDSDNDHSNDGAELRLGSLPFTIDTDDDNLTDGFELEWGSNPVMVDSDMDNLQDLEEFFTNATRPDSNKNLILDGDELYAHDVDRDGLSNLLELDASDGNITDPTNPDTDFDGLYDGQEDANKNGRREGNDPTDKKSDWGSGGETDPLDMDTDGGWVPDGIEVNFGRDPLNPEDDPEFEFDFDPNPRTPRSGSPWSIGIDPTVCLTLILVVVIIIIALLVIYSSVSRKKKLIDEIIEILETGERELYQLDTGDDIRNAIYRTYKAFLEALTKYNLARRASMTVQEFAVLVRSKLPIRAGPVTRLTNVFEEARYSDHVMDLASKNRAIESFREVREDLSMYKEKLEKSKETDEGATTTTKLIDKVKKSIIKK
jgi:hypothetical protein